MPAADARRRAPGSRPPLGSQMPSSTPNASSFCPRVRSFRPNGLPLSETSFRTARTAFRLSETSFRTAQTAFRLGRTSILFSRRSFLLRRTSFRTGKTCFRWQRTVFRRTVPVWLMAASPSRTSKIGRSPNGSSTAVRRVERRSTSRHATTCVSGRHGPRARRSISFPCSRRRTPIRPRALR